MPVPPFQTYFLPMLKQYKNGDKIHIKDVRNLVAKELRTQKYRPRIVKPKKGKGSFKRKKVNLV